MQRPVGNPFDVKLDLLGYNKVEEVAETGGIVFTSFAGQTSRHQDAIYDGSRNNWRSFRAKIPANLPGQDAKTKKREGKASPKLC